MSTDLEIRSHQLLGVLGLSEADESVELQPLKGGVSSDIIRARTRQGTYCVKFALEKLKVAESWHAPTHRNSAEYAWLSFVGRYFPENVPSLFGQNSELGGFAMECISGNNVRNWKSDLLKNGPHTGDSEAVGTILGEIHSLSARKKLNAGDFGSLSDFTSLRLEPYLLRLLQVYPELFVTIRNLVQRTSSKKIALVHGDVSPKNILFRDGTPILLDSECATLGDPAFDAAFCINHLVLKAIHLPSFRRSCLEAAGEFWTAYRSAIDWEPSELCEARVATLLPALLLARVDGKSPVEYLGDPGKKFARSFSIELLRNPDPRFGHFFDRLKKELGAFCH